MARGRFSRALAVVALLCAATPALAQSTYPTPVGTRVAGVVVLQCDTAGANCTPSGSISGVNSKVTICDFSVSCAQVSAPSDSLSNSIGTVAGSSYSQVFNGTTWDRARGDVNGAVVQPALSANYWSFAAATGGIVNTTTAVTIKAAAGASVRNYLCSVQIAHDTLGAATELAIRDGAAGTVLWRGKLQTTLQDASPDTINFYPCLRGTANTLMEAVTLTAVTGGVFVNAQGYTGS